MCTVRVDGMMVKGAMLVKQKADNTVSDSKLADAVRAKLGEPAILEIWREAWLSPNERTEGMMTFTALPANSGNPTTRFELREGVSLEDAIQQVVLAERERCAKICDVAASDRSGSNPACAEAEFLASEIRRG